MQSYLLVVVAVVVVVVVVVEGAKVAPFFCAKKVCHSVTLFFVCLPASPVRPFVCLPHFCLSARPKEAIWQKLYQKGQQ